MRKILVTAGLPYANGAIHLGHLLEYIQADIWTRFHKIIGNNCFFICGDDAHGTAIMISSKKQNISPEELISSVKSSHEKDFKDFYINFDSFYTTHSDENNELVKEIYNKLREKGDIEKRVIEQLYDQKEGIFLPDRFVKGECPRCTAKEQYGDNCDNCGATYSPLDLKNPVSAISGTAPVLKEAEHFFFSLNKYKDFLKNWVNAEHLQSEIVNKLGEWLASDLKPWDISRDAPYFGFKIPDTSDKYFYVWLDAPIGYMASFKKLCNELNLDFKSYWEKGSDAELYHFIGKDIVYFHALFWPAILASADLRTPTAIFTHGFLTVNGQKMSKSKGTFILASDYLKHLNPEHLRYYFATKLSKKIEDIDLNFEDFMNRVNSDLVGKIINIASRSVSFLSQFDNYLACKFDFDIIDGFVSVAERVKALYEEREYANVTKLVITLASRANLYINDKKPWKLNKIEEEKKNVHVICTTSLNLFRLIVIYLSPILPNLTKKVEEFLNASLSWDAVNHILVNHKINEFRPLMQRIEKETIDALINESKEI